MSIERIHLTKLGALPDHHGDQREHLLVHEDLLEDGVLEQESLVALEEDVPLVRVFVLAAAVQVQLRSAVRDVVVNATPSFGNVEGCAQHLLYELRGADPLRLDLGVAERMELERLPLKA
jgi:hypothetical protein